MTARIIRSLRSSFFRYVVAGIGTNLAAYAVFLLLIRVGVSHSIAVATVYLFGLAMSYVVHRQWTFQSSAEHKFDIPKFLAVYGSGLILSEFAFHSLVRIFSPWLAQLANMALTAVFLFAALTLSGFGKKHQAP